MVELFDEDEGKILQRNPSNSRPNYGQVVQQPKYGPVVQQPNYGQVVQQPSSQRPMINYQLPSPRVTAPSRLLSLQEYFPNFRSTVGKRAGTLRKWLPTIGGDKASSSERRAIGSGLLSAIEPIKIAPLQFPERQAQSAQAISDYGIGEGSTLTLCLPLAAAAEVENLSQKKKDLLWIEMETPDEGLAEYSMSVKAIKKSGTIQYECSMKKVRGRDNCNASVVHYYDERQPTVVRAQHNHPPPNRAAKAAINRAKDEAVRFTDHRVSGIIDRAHRELEEDDEIALPSDRRMAENIRYARKEESTKRIDDTPLYKLRIADMGTLAMTIKGKQFMVYNSVEDPRNRGKKLLWTFVCPKAEQELLKPGAIVCVDSSYKMAIGGKGDPDNRRRDGYSRSFAQVFNMMLRIGEGTTSGWVYIGSTFMSDKTKEAHIMALNSILRRGVEAYDIALWACDFCPSQAGAILELFPDAQIGHCVKHFDSNLGKAVAKNGLSGLERGVRSFEKLVRLYKRLPFLPEHDVAVGFKAIGQKMAELFEDELVETRYLHGVHDFLLHIWNTYVKPRSPYPTKRWTVFERMMNFLPITSNPVENLHGKMNKYIAHKSPPVSTAIGILKKFEDRDRRALIRHEPGQAFRGRMRTRQHNFELSLHEMGAAYSEHDRTRSRIIKYLKSIDKAYIQHYKRKRRDGEESDMEAPEEENAEDGDDESVDDEEEELNPGDELLIPEEEEEDETFDNWFAHNFPELPEQHAAQTGGRRRQRAAPPNPQNPQDVQRILQRSQQTLRVLRREREERQREEDSRSRSSSGSNRSSTPMSSFLPRR